MPKNELFKCQNYSSKNYSFYLFQHFIFENAIQKSFRIYFYSFFFTKFKHAEETSTTAPTATVIIFSGCIF